MTRVLRSLTSQLGALLMCTLAASGCSHTPYSPAATTPYVLSGILSGGALQTARVKIRQEKSEVLAEEKPMSVCPGNGSAACEINWRFLEQGQTAGEVANWLGQPAQQTGPDIYIEKVVAEWQYQHDGVVYFENDELRYVDLPTSFEYNL